jgi:predicted ArsR family transcriptional regulator
VNDFLDSFFSILAKHLCVSWNTVQIHLFKLMAEGRVKGRKVGRQNQWIISREAKT